METIIALSTPIGRGAVAVVRMSGDDTLSIAKKVFAPFPQHARVMQYGKVTVDDFADQAMCVYFSAPHSYTGEDVVELHLHGGVGVCTAVIDKCIEYGARMAQNGEFSKRAFVNGKQNLTNAEGIIELIEAENKLQLASGMNLLSNKLGKQTIDMQARLTDMLASVEAMLDYPEEQLETEDLPSVLNGLMDISKQLQQLLSTVKTGRIIKQGINVVIVGASNVGKSSLLNCLLGQDRAIVSSQAGTTRDTVTDSINYKDITINFVDTAGIRKTRYKLEQEGIRRSQCAINQADIILYVVDNHNTVIPNMDKPTIKVYNKCDLLREDKRGDYVYVSALNGENIVQLKDIIYDTLKIGQIDMSNVILTSARHVEVLTRTLNCIKSAIDNSTDNTADCIAQDIKEAWMTLGEITGQTSSQDIIDRIYSKFCLGK
ncbi:MAG: tRNA uridine-5-carboxymethylaminomethyl(34) synthesis GTPase MnmE [Clostridia bacterium]|nr:tRNA uridine-5-carboxymethylaminomethyl(34) synthesis GTPase MnmE [Clostridia bacterium]